MYHAFSKITFSILSLEGLRKSDDVAYSDEAPSPKMSTVKRYLYMRFSVLRITPVPESYQLKNPLFSRIYLV